MNESILHTVKKIIGIVDEYTAFDEDLIAHINTVLLTLIQIGVPTASGEFFSIEDSSATWRDFIGDRKDLEFIKSYVPLKVKQMFDMSGSGGLNDAIQKRIDELEFRISVTVDDHMPK